MRGMSIKAQIGWALALAVGFIAFMAVMAAQPSWGKHPESQVHYYYMVAFACTEDRMNCIQLPPDEFPTYDKCFEHLMDVKTEERYTIPGHPLVVGKCISLPDMGVEA